MPAEGSFFLEIEVVDASTEELRAQLPEGISLAYPGHTPPVSLPKGLRFYFLRPELSDRTIIETHPFFQDRLIGQSWEEVAYKPYRFRDYVLQASISRLGVEGVMRVPLAEVRPSDTLAEQVAYPPGVFSGDPVPTFPISELPPIRAASEEARAGLKAQLAKMRESLRGSNTISEADRAELERALDQCEREASARAVDHKRISRALRNARDFAGRIGEALIASAIWAGLVWLRENWPALPF